MKFSNVLYLIVMCMASVVTIGIMVFSCVQLALGATPSDFYTGMLCSTTGLWIGAAIITLKKFDIEVNMPTQATSSFPITIRTVNSE